MTSCIFWHQCGVLCVWSTGLHTPQMALDQWCYVTEFCQFGSVAFRLQLTNYLSAQLFIVCVQLYIIQAPVHDHHTITCVCMLLQWKNQDTYKTFLQAVVDRCQSIVKTQTPDTVTTNFEYPTMQAILHVLGDEVTMKGCSTTWHKARGGTYKNLA